MTTYEVSLQRVFHSKVARITVEAKDDLEAIYSAETIASDKGHDALSEIATDHIDILDVIEVA